MNEFMRPTQSLEIILNLIYYYQLNMGAIRVRRQTTSKGKHAVEGHYVKNQNKTIPEREIALAA
jgi:hypothetical protein